ncbi:F0F1 ATP synthase subunit gamma [Candidatus Omnitrophota bacterium]
MKILSLVKKDMEFNQGLHSLLGVLKTIAVSEFHVLEKKMQAFEKFSQTLEGFLELIDVRYFHHPFVNPARRAQGIVAVTSEKGLLGGLNNQVMAAACNELTKKKGKLFVVGERGELFVRERNIAAVAFPAIQDEERFSQAVQLRNYLFSEVGKGEIGALKIVYPRAISFTVQRVEIMDVLPYTPKKTKPAEREYFLLNTIWESNPEEILEYIVYLLMAQLIYEVFGWSRLAELAARFVHLEESSQKLQDLNQKLRLEYFRIRHELVDRNMRELFAARALFSH